MTLLLTLLPLYLLGNLHCIGMCGPLVMMIGQHRFRYFYFAGRMLSFTLAGTLAGAVGEVLNLVLNQYHIPAFTSLMFGSVVLIIGLYTMAGWQYPGHQWLGLRLVGVNRTLSMLILSDRALPIFLFGFFTILLPCGQTLVVFSACAVAGDLWVGMLNGFAFALLTSPSLVMALHAHSFLARFKPYYKQMMGISALVVGTLMLCRGFAEIGYIDHLILNENYHFVIF